MILNNFGKIAHEEWKISGEIRDEIEIKTFIIMPNHLHGIVILNNKINNQLVGRHGRASLPDMIPNLTFNSSFYRKPKSISSFIAGYKSSVTTKINNFIDKNPEIMEKLNINQKYNKRNRLWQTNYYDHIIRNNDDYNKIMNYIKNNVQKHIYLK